MHLPSGLYEQIVNLAIAEGIRAIGKNRQEITEPLRGDASHPLLARYLHEVLARGLTYLRDKFSDEEVLTKQVAACNQLIELMASITNEEELLEWRIGPENQLLLAVLERRNTSLALTDADKTRVLRPDTSLSMSTLFTGSAHEPSMMGELKKEILTADRIDLLVSFIKWSGLRLIMDELQEHTKTKPLRVITTSYMGATDLKAMLELIKLPNTEVKVSYDTRSTRLHAKSYTFYRETGFSTTYIGSSNLSNAAIGSGLEWNVKVTEKDMPHILRNVQATFETYWNDDDFQLFLEKDEQNLRTALKAERYSEAEDQYLFRIEPYPFQKEILEKLDAERKLHGRYRNLVVAATGTGKTVISAFDYKRFCRDNPNKPNRLLFVAHRREILQQSLKCFRAILRDNNFGELFYGDNRAERFDHLFISIQTFNSQEFTQATSKDYYDFIIVDEFHHAAAPSYQELLSYYQPKVLLGLTATPERMDGYDILGTYFDGRMAAEVRLPEAINRQLLVPFQYFGVTDDLDLSNVRFERGRYDIAQLENIYTGNDMRTDAILKALRRYITDINQVMGLGFCVGVEHAKYMAERFTKKGIPSLALHGGSTQEERNSAQRKLVSSEVHFIFTVDLYNEGVDIPEVNTVLFLRPTESLTVFLQQLGRGLRLHEGKDVLTVLDFIGLAHQQYSFESKFRAMMSRTTRSVQKELEEGFSSLPRGCHVQLERIARETVLQNIKEAILNKNSILRRLRTFTADTGEQPTLTSFLRTYEAISPGDIYRRGAFAKLCVEAGVRAPYQSPDDTALAKAFLRLSRIDSRRYVQFLTQALRQGLPARLSLEEQRMLHMFHYVVWQKVPKAIGLTDSKAGLERVRSNTVLCTELLELLTYCYEHIAFVDKPVDLGFPCPLDLHCTYSRDEVLAAV
ncbi:MAG: DEAD/DEAH box helicase family protein, partial [Bacillota bacterium]|nr:DEAD/DEAH box helicase family protein [Bacillota bacterium]